MAIQCCKFQESLFRKVVVIDEYYYSWLQKNGNCQNKTDTFLQFFHSVKPFYER
jgi:hypothetical protein